jgi:hypothetical protein
MPVQCRHCHHTYENYQIRQHEAQCQEKRYIKARFKGGARNLANKMIVEGPALELKKDKPYYIMFEEQADYIVKIEQGILRYQRGDIPPAPKQAKQAESLGQIASKVAQEHLDEVYKDNRAGYNTAIREVRALVEFMSAKGDRYFTRDLANAFQALAVGLEAALDVGEKEEEEEDDDGAWSRDRY